MSNLRVHDGLLEYTISGQGESLVLVHGSASDYRTWHNQQTELACHYRVISYSRRYHWPNATIPVGADYAMWQQLEDLEALIRQLDAAPAHLVGHSYGAFLCLLLAIKAPQLVRTLVLAEPPVITLFASSRPRPREILTLLLTRPRTAVAMIHFAATGIVPAEAAARRDEVTRAVRGLGRTILGHEYYDRLSGRRLAQVDANAIKAEFLGSGFAPLKPEQVQNIGVPALLINGQHSHRIFHRLMDRLAQLLRDCERIEIADASHIMHEDNARAYNQAVLSFLNKYRGMAQPGTPV